VGGTVVNQRFSPNMLRGSAGTALLRSLVQTYFAHGGMQMQFNVTGGETLRAAIEDPAAYGDLLVRVSGFSALYVGLSREVQEDILARTEHGWEEMAWSD
jgi:pyruvate-formate lyase